MPSNWSAFLEYNQDMWSSETLTVTRPAREIASFLFRPLHPLLGPPTALYRRLTAGLLPPRVRDQFELPFGAADARLLATTLVLLRRSQPLWPRRLHYLPPYIAARRRVAGDTRPDRLGAWLDRLLVGG